MIEWPEWKLDALERYAREGKSNGYIGGKLYLSRDTVRGMRVKLGLPMNAPKNPNPHRVNETTFPDPVATRILIERIAAGIDRGTIKPPARAA